MKKLIAVLVYAGVFSVPSVVLAEANWYGSLRVGVESSDSNLSVVDGQSRWGIKGFVEAGEGLFGFYRFETKIDATDASLPGGRLSFVGLSGGFGRLTLGQIWSASYTSTGTITDNSNFYGGAETTYRHGNAISYSFSNDLMKLQTDLVYGDGNQVLPTVRDPEIATDDPNEDLERTEFGLTIDVGDNAAVAFSHQNDKYTAILGALNNVPTVTTWKIKTNIVAAQISVTGITVYAGKKKRSFDFIANLTNPGTASTRADDETTFFGVRGSVGDTGMDYVFQWRDKDTSKPWLLAFNKGIGDSTELILEHLNNDDDMEPNKTQLSLKIDF